MFDHPGLPVTDLEQARRFYEQALGPLGIGVAKTGPAADRAQVQAFHRTALAAGARDNGAPGLCLRYHEHYYAAFVTGPDGHNLEAVCHPATEATP
jgi:catechol 2,3-dioxygenase-like lactoylglutathione lyase family enzyme